MQQTPFHAYYTARRLECLSDEERLISAFASADIEVYPFQIAAAAFALRSPNQKGVILCDEAGMGKSHEAMLAVSQSWLEGRSRILLVVPNTDLLTQWAELIERDYTIPYVVFSNRKEWNEAISEENENAFAQNALVLTTYAFAAEQERFASAVHWDMTVFEEANALSNAYQGGRQANALRRIAGNSFKLLLTGTPIEKNLMDLYGLIWFIDETILPAEREFLARYLRRPENYPELAGHIGSYCFRTLRSQAKDYAKLPNRVLITLEYTPSPPERELYELLYAYVNSPTKYAFPEMERYDLALRLLGLQSSSSAAVAQTARGIIRRLEAMPEAEAELAQWRRIQTAAEQIKRDSKATELLSVLQSGFELMQKRGANKKAIIFTESIETQKMLSDLLGSRYKTLRYHGGADYATIREFKESGEILLSTDSGAKGFNLEEAAFVIQYDLPYNTLKLEQRIDRVHRLGQKNDVLAFAFIAKHNFSDVRKLELINKRMLVADGVFGLTDDLIGGFTETPKEAFRTAGKALRTREQIERDYQETLMRREPQNRVLISAAETILFTTFTYELAKKLRITPQYVREQAEECSAALWRVAKCFFEQYNAEHNGCVFAIDDEAQTVTPTQYEVLPVLFYSWDGSRNRKYQSLKAYGMAREFKPRQGRITLTSTIGRGILHEIKSAEYGECTVQTPDGGFKRAEVGLYSVRIFAGKGQIADIPLLCGKTDSGEILSDEACRRLLSLPVEAYTERGDQYPHWLKIGAKSHMLDSLVPVEALLDAQKKKRLSLRAEETEQMKLRTAVQKNELNRSIADLEAKIRAAEAERESVWGDRMKRLALEKKTNLLRQELLKKQESRFFDEMRLDMELEQGIQALTDREKLSAKVIREFILTIHTA